MAKILTCVAVSYGKAMFFVGTLFAYELKRLGFRLHMGRGVWSESRNPVCALGDRPDTRRDKSPGDS